MTNNVRLVIFLTSLFIYSFSNAQDSIVEDFSAEEFSIVEKIDSLTGAYFESAFNGSTKVKKAEHQAWMDSVLSRSDDEMLTAMTNIPSEIPLSYNSRVRRYIEVYAIDRREKTREILGLTDFYFPVFEEYLDRKKLPHVLKYLPIVESALNANAVSRAGATGLWQIMYSTGKMLGLEINSFVDERRDPYLSTEAALNYLSHLHGIYGDWLLVIAAYNCGPGNVNKAIARSGGKRNFWQIMQYLPQETRGYVPAFMGALFVFTHYEEFGIEPLKPKYSFNMIDTIMLTKQVSISAIASELSMNEEELEFLNPALKKKIIPVAPKGYALKLPVVKVGLFETRKDSIYNKLPDEKELMLARSEISTEWNTTASAANKGNLVKLTYKVKSGDNLGYIAEWYKCTAQQIRNWNNLYGSNIAAGQRLSIYVHKDFYDHFSAVDRMSFSEKQSYKSASPKASPKLDANITPDAECGCVYYKVREGDTLWEISRKYRVAVDVIQKHNNISNGNELKPGMVLKIMI